MGTHSGMGTGPCCIAHIWMLLCKQSRCRGIWYTLNLSRHDGTATASRQPEKSDVQNRYDRPFDPQHFLQPLPGYPRPLADGLRGGEHPQRRHSARRTLNSSELRNSRDCRGLHRDASFLPELGSGFPEPFFCPRISREPSKLSQAKVAAALRPMRLRIT